MNSTLTWTGEMTMSCENRGLISVFDATPDHGGQDKGPTPKEMLLNSMSACSAMDVVSIAKKMRLPLTSLKIHAEADKTTTTPSYFSEVRTKYYAEGDIDADKIIKAVTLSMTKYCGVSYMVSLACPIKYEVVLNGKTIFTGQADFHPETTHG